VGNKLRFGIIGCGRVAPKHVEALVNNFQEAELVALCDLEDIKALELKQKYTNLLESRNLEVPEITIYTDYVDMLNRSDIDVVSIATYSGTHARIALDVPTKKRSSKTKPMVLTCLGLFGS